MMIDELKNYQSAIIDHQSRKLSLVAGKRAFHHGGVAFLILSRSITNECNF